MSVYSFAKKFVLGLRNWLRNGSVVKSTGCSCRGLGFDSQHPHDGLQPSVTQLPGYPAQSYDSC